VVAVVDAYSTARFLPPLFAERGYDVLHVRSRPRIPSVFGHLIREHFVNEVVHTGNDAATVEAVSAHRPVALLAGAESGVEVADVLSERLGVRTNGTAQSPARRDKFLMIETVRAAGLAVAAQARVSSEKELREWYEKVGATRVVVKPLRSALNDGVHFCDDADAAVAGLVHLVGSDSALDLHNAEALVQEYLPGVEYYVNTVSLDGRHHVTDVHSTIHVTVNGVRDLLAGSHLLPRRGPAQDRLVPYVLSVLDALGIRNGPAHTEVKLTPDGPRLVEVGARACGADLPVLVDDAIGESQLAWTVDAYVEPSRFERHHHQDYVIDRHGVCVNMISPCSGTLRGLPRMAEVEALPSFVRALPKVRIGGQIQRTVDDISYPFRLHLLHASPDVVEHDYATVRWLDGDGFYEVE
jgi:hypothetical protein